MLSSKMTSVNSVKLPAIYNKIDWSKVSGTVCDYGCGRYTDHIREFLRKKEIGYNGFDPYWYPDGIIEGDIFICSNVLNVIQDEQEMHRVHNVLINSGKPYFITVYEGDCSGMGRVTKVDCYQRNEPLKDYAYNGENIKKKVLTNHVDMIK